MRQRDRCPAERGRTSFFRSTVPHERFPCSRSAHHRIPRSGFRPAPSLWGIRIRRIFVAAAAVVRFLCTADSNLRWLRLHGTAAVLMLIIVGSLLPIRLRVGWHQRKNLLAGYNPRRDHGAADCFRVYVVLQRRSITPCHQYAALDHRPRRTGRADLAYPAWTGNAFDE